MSCQILNHFLLNYFINLSNISVQVAPSLAPVCQMQTVKRTEFAHFAITCSAFPENKPFDAGDGKVVSTSNQWDKAKTNEVSVTFTLSSAAAKVLTFFVTASFLPFLYSCKWTKTKTLTVVQNLNHVMVAMAQLLNIRMPVSYEVTFPPSPGMPGVVGPGKGPDQSGTCILGPVLV